MLLWQQKKVVKTETSCRKESKTNFNRKERGGEMKTEV